MITVCAKLTKFALLGLLIVGLVACGGSKELAQIEESEPEVAAPPPPAPVKEEVKTAPATETAAPAPLVLETIHFDYDKYDLTPEARQILATNAMGLRAHPEANILIQGHCDERGTIEYNLALGDKRARAVKDYLVSLNIDPAQISTISYGKERPVDTRRNEEAWARNRRAEFARQ